MTAKTTQVIAVDSGEIISKEQLKGRIQTFIEFGGERVCINREEVAEIRMRSNAADGASLILIGFKPLDSIPLHLALEKSYFAYPNEDPPAGGSRAAVSALHASMVRRGVLAVCELLARATSTSRLVAMTAQEEERDEWGDGVSKQISPPGFVVTPLPYEEDVREVEADCGVRADKAAVDAMVNLVRRQKLRNIEFGYSFENPALANFWDFVESVALGLPLPETEPDETRIDPDEIIEMAGVQIEALRLSLPNDDVEEKKKAGQKRKTAELVPDDSGVDWVDFYKTDGLSVLTIDILKKYLRSVGCKLGGRKSELVERVKASIAERLQDNTANSSGAVAVKEEYV